MKFADFSFIFSSNKYYLNLHLLTLLLPFLSGLWGDTKTIGSLSNHDERDDDDDVKYAQRDWDENVAFGGKMKLKQRGCSRTTTKEFPSDSPRI